MATESSAKRTLPLGSTEPSGSVGKPSNLTEVADAAISHRPAALGIAKLGVASTRTTSAKSRLVMVRAARAI